MKFISKKKLELILSDISKRELFSYSKKRASGSKPNNYIMHPRSTCMPGQVNLFVYDSKTIPEDKSENNMLMLRNLYQREKYLIQKQSIGNKFIYNSKDLFTYEKFYPYDDETLEIALLASYKQIYGNLYPMEADRSLDSERRLRNGDITIREFIRIISKSDFYLHHFFEKVNQSKCVELNFMHLLGRPILDNDEFRRNIDFISKRGFKAHVDSLINSIEYEEFFGEDIVPYQRFWNSPCGSTSSAFLRTASYRKGCPSSDNVNYK